MGTAAASTPFAPTSLLLAQVEAVAATHPGRRAKAADLRVALDTLRGPSSDPEPIDVVTLVRGVVEVAVGADRDASRVKLVFDQVAGLTAQGHRGEIALGLLQLVTNAVQAARARPDGTVRVFVTRSLKGGAYIEISDNGPGMGPTTLRAALLPFFSTRPGHEGLGLPVAAALLRAAGASLALESALGAGTVVTVVLR